MRTYIHNLSHSYLLTLCTEGTGCYPLGRALRRVLRSESASVWVDCRHVAALPTEALRMLRPCAACLWQRGGYLVLCHLPTATRAELQADATQPLAASLLDAQQYGLDCPTPDLAQATAVASESAQPTPQ
jgi:hypothetical protein